ncbi:hypothetical protein IAT40_007817 [Kwoniella sp. CBS 6097]
MSNLQAALNFGQVFVIRSESGSGKREDASLDCVAIVTRPGLAWDPEDKRKYHQASFEGLPPAAEEFLRQVAARTPAMYHIPAIATWPATRKKGLASSMLKYIEHLANGEKTCVALYTVSDYAASLYQRWGFESIFFGGSPGEGTSFVMVKNPVPTSLRQ